MSKDVKIISNLEVMRLVIGRERRKKGFNKSEIADLADTHLSTVSKYESLEDISNLQLKSFVKIAMALDIPPFKFPGEKKERYLAEIEFTED